MDGPVPNHTPYSLCRPHTSQPQSTSSMDISVWKFLKTARLVHYVSDNWRNAIHCGISLVHMPRKAHTTHWKPWEHLEVCQISMTPSSGTVEWAMKSGFGYLFFFSTIGFCFLWRGSVMLISFPRFSLRWVTWNLSGCDLWSDWRWLTGTG